MFEGMTQTSLLKITIEMQNATDRNTFVTMFFVNCL